MGHRMLVKKGKNHVDCFFHIFCLNGYCDIATQECIHLACTFVNDIVCDARHKTYVITHLEQFNELEERLRLINK